MQVHGLEDELEEARADNVELSRVWPHLDTVTRQLEETRAGALVGAPPSASPSGASKTRCCTAPSTLDPLNHEP